MLPRLLQLGDLFLLGRDQRVELRNFAGVLPLLMLAEAEQVGHVLRPPAVEVEFVFGDDGLEQLLALVRFGITSDAYPVRPNLGVDRYYRSSIDLHSVV